MALFSWWYGRGWRDVARGTRTMVTGVSQMFSVPILIRTLFAPWKRIVTYPGASLEAKLQAFGDNLVSRAVGFVVRLLVLLTACVVSVITLALGGIVTLVWPFIPLGVIVFVILGAAS